jgi:hypothetical protein
VMMYPSLSSVVQSGRYCALGSAAFMNCTARLLAPSPVTSARPWLHATSARSVAPAVAARADVRIQAMLPASIACPTRSHRPRSHAFR